jgi:hypothetical protein
MSNKGHFHVPRIGKIKGLQKAAQEVQAEKENFVNNPEQQFERPINICPVLALFLEKRYGKTVWLSVVDYFPELKSEKPQGVWPGDSWFSTNQQRLQAITRTIFRLQAQPAGK